MPRLLLVEDNVLSSDMLCRRLRRRGFDVALAADGREGVEKALADLPDLILMDMNLPEIDGWEATRLIRADHQTSTVPILALTAHAMSSHLERALSAGCDDFATKPVDFEKLVEKINSLLRRSR